MGPITITSRPSSCGSKFSVTIFPRMVDPTGKVDPIREKYYRPLECAEKASDILFYVTATLSLLALLVDKTSSTHWHNAVHVLFVLGVVITFVLGWVIRFWF